MKRALAALFSSALYGLAGLVSRAAVFTFARWEVVGAEHVPRTGAFVAIANHLHLLDPPLVAASCPRRLRTMAKAELFDTPLVGWALRPYGAFPVRRFSADVGALRAARTLLREGHAVLLFPEGTRSRDAKLHPGLPGAAMIALMERVPVLPIAITGSEAVELPGTLFGLLLGRPRPRIRVTFGAPFALATTDGRAAEAATDEMMRHLAALLPEEYRGAYGAGSEGRIVVARQERSGP